MFSLLLYIYILYTVCSPSSGGSIQKCLLFFLPSKSQLFNFAVQKFVQRNRGYRFENAVRLSIKPKQSNDTRLFTTLCQNQAETDAMFKRFAIFWLIIIFNLLETENWKLWALSLEMTGLGRSVGRLFECVLQHTEWNGVSVCFVLFHFVCVHKHFPK